MLLLLGRIGCMEAHTRNNNSRGDNSGDNSGSAFSALSKTLSAPSSPFNL